MNNDLLYRIALTLVPSIGDVHAKALIHHFGDALAVFAAKRSALESVEGIGETRARQIKRFTGFDRAEAEMAFIEKYRITPLFITDPAYPQRLLHCCDSPLLLYYRGNADLNASRVVAIVGTRSHTSYGKWFTEQLTEALSKENVLIVSGLAFGIDTIAHRAALKHQTPTVGVLAHGLDRIYPQANQALARQMTGNGGLLTDFKSGHTPDRQNFPRRNRIVAGMCDALVVVESGLKGGSLITATLANGYNKDVFAVPGKTTDVKSEGCNALIRSNKAGIITTTADLLESMGWIPAPARIPQVQRKLFVELSASETVIVNLLSQHPTLPVDELHFQSGLNNSAVATALLQLEMQGLVRVLPGKLYQLV